MLRYGFVGFGILIALVAVAFTIRGDEPPWKLVLVAPIVLALIAFGASGLYQRVRVVVDDRARTARIQFVEWPWPRPPVEVRLDGIAQVVLAIDHAESVCRIEIHLRDGDVIPLTSGWSSGSHRLPRRTEELRRFLLDRPGPPGGPTRRMANRRRRRSPL